MRKNIKALAIVLCLVLITCCVASSTLALYSSSLGSAATPSARVAKWIKLGNSYAVTVGDFFKTTYGTTAVSEEKIVAPGTSGSSAISIPAFDQAPEVAYEIVATVKNNGSDSTLAGYIEINVNGTWTLLSGFTDDGKDVTLGSFAAGEKSPTTTEMIEWRWEAGSEDSAASTLAETGSAEVKLSITFKATQSLPVAPGSGDGG